MNQNNFLSHAVYKAESVHAVLQEGEVKPSELTFRQTGVVEHEDKELDRRITLDISAELADIKNMIASMISSEDGYYMLGNWAFSEDASHRLIFNQWDFNQLNSLNQQELIEIQCKEGSEVSEVQAAIFEKYPHLKKVLCTHHIRCIIDAILPRKQQLDTLLSCYYFQLKEKGVSPKEAFEKCSDLRYKILGSALTGMRAQVRTYRDKIDWRYGQVVILKGNADTIGTRKIIYIEEASSRHQHFFYQASFTDSKAVCPCRPHSI